MDPASHSYDTATHLVAAAILKHLKLAGVPLATERERIYLGRLADRAEEHRQGPDTLCLLQDLDLFDGLPKEALTDLAGHMTSRKLKTGTELFRTGETGATLYIVTEGLLEVLIEDKQGNTHSVKTLEPGDYVGEMALLTGEPRSATIRTLTPAIVWEIEREAMKALLDHNPDLLERLSLNLAARKNANARKLAGSSKADDEGETSMATVLLERMRAFFRFTRRPFPTEQTPPTSDDSARPS